MRVSNFLQSCNKYFQRPKHPIVGLIIYQVWYQFSVSEVYFVTMTNYQKEASSERKCLFDFAVQVFNSSYEGAMVSEARGSNSHYIQNQDVQIDQC